MNRFLRISIILLTVFVAACSEESDPPTTAPANVTALGGEGLVALNWTKEDGITYWVYYKQGATVSSTDADRILYNIEPPFLVSELDNGSQYALTMTSSRGGSPVGPFSPVVTATPRALDPSVPWTVGSPLTTNNLNGVSFGSDTYVIVGDGASVFTGDYVYTDVGGVSSWETPTTMPASYSSNLVAVAYAGSRFVAMGSDGTIIKSVDSTDATVPIDVTSWETATDITSPPTMNALAYFNGTYVAVGNSGAIYTNTTADVSADWTAQTSGTTNHLLGVVTVNAQFIAVGAQGTILTSANGVTWTEQTSNTNSDLYGITFGDDTYVAVGNAGTIVSSDDTETWTVQATPTGESFRDVTFGVSQQFIAVGTNGAIAYSTTGADGSWAMSTAGTVELNKIVNNWVYIAVGNAGANVSGK